MDLNYFFARHQIFLVRSTAAATVGARSAHCHLANAYASEIRESQDLVGATTAPLQEIEA